MLGVAREPVDLGAGRGPRPDPVSAGSRGHHGWALSRHEILSTSPGGCRPNSSRSASWGTAVPSRRWGPAKRGAERLGFRIGAAWNERALLGLQASFAQEWRSDRGLLLVAHGGHRHRSGGVVAGLLGFITCLQV
jgi:hypothetical protein